MIPMEDKQNKELKEYIECNKIVRHKDAVVNIILLSDGRISSCSIDGRINIYNKDTYQKDIMIDIFEFIFYHTQLSNDNIIACCGLNNHNILRIYKIRDYADLKYDLIQKLEGHNDWVWKVIEIEENKLVSSSKDNTIKIWEKNMPDFFAENNYNCIKTITINSNSNNKPINIIKIKENELAAFSYGDKLLKFFDIKNDFKEIATINNIINGCDPNSMCVFDDNTLLIGGYESSGIYLINTLKHEVISIVNNNIKEVNSFLKLSNGNILIGCKDENNANSLIEYKFYNNNLIKINSKENAHEKDIYSLIEMKDGTIVSSSADVYIKFWKIGAPQSQNRKKDFKFNNDNKIYELSIELDSKGIIFELKSKAENSNHNYIKIYNYDDILKELNLSKNIYNDLEKVFNYLDIKEFKIIEDKEGVKIILNNKNEINLYELSYISAINWKDFSSKYGLGYLLSDGNVGIHFVDDTKIIYKPNGNNFIYIEKNKEKQNIITTHLFSEKFDKDLNNKIILLQKFTEIFLEENKNTFIENKEKKNIDDNNYVYINKWLKMKNVLIFYFSNKDTQACFVDGTQLILAKTHYVVYRDKKGQIFTKYIDSVSNSNHKEIFIRLKLFKKALQDIIKSKQNK